MKFKILLKKFVFYLGAFIALFSVTAGVKVGLFFITKGSDDAPNQNETTTGADNSLSKVLNNVLQTDNANLDLNLELQTDQTASPIKLQSNVALNMPKMTTYSAPANANAQANNNSGLELSLNGSMELNSQIINYDINYLNGFIYAKFGDATFKLETNNLANDINKILNFGVLKKFGINIELPDLSNFNFDASMLTSLASSMIETDTEQGKELSINLFGYGTAKLLTDNDYVLKSIVLDGLNFNGTKIVADIQADLTAEKKEISEPANKNDINDFTELTKFLETADKLLDKGYASGKIDISLLKNNLSFDYLFDFNDFDNLSAYLKTSIFNSDFIMQINKDKALVQLNDYKYYFSLPFDTQEIIDSITYYAQKFGIELPTGEIESLVSRVNINNLNQILEYVSDLKVDGNGATFRKNEIEINLQTKDGEFSVLTAHYKDILGLNITLNESINKVELDEDEFTDLLQENVFQMLHEQIIKNKCLSLKANLTINDTPLQALIKVDCTDEIKVQLSLEVLNQNIVLTIIDDKIYLEAENVLRAKGSIKQILDFAKNNHIIPQESTAINLETIKNLILSTLQNNNIAFEITKEDGHIKTLNMQTNIVSGDIYVVPFENIEFTEQGEYQNVEDICNFVYNLLNVINGKKLAFEFSAMYNEYNLSGKVQYLNGNLLAKVQTVLFDKNLAVELENDNIFINYDGLKLRTSLNNLKDLSSSIEKCFGINIDEFINSDNFDIDEILSNLKLEILSNRLQLSYDKLFVYVNTQNFGINFNYDTIIGQISFTDEFAPSSKDGYINLDGLNGLIKATLKTLKNRSISGNVKVTLELFGEANLLNINYAVSLKDNNLIGYIHTYFKGLKISAFLDNKDIYLDIASMKVHFNIDNLQEMVDWFNTTFNQNISVDFDELLSVDKLKELNLDIIKSVVSSNNNAVVTLKNDLEISINYGEYIGQVNFTQANRHAQLNCTDFEEINLDLDKSQFKNFDFYTTIIENIYQLVSSKQYDINASVNTYSNDTLTNSVSANVQLDISSLLNAYVDILGLDEQITVNYSNKMLYVRYGGVSGLKLSIEENALQEILSILCSALNFDTSSIPFLDDFLTKENIDTGNLSSILPTIELTNPLQYLEYIEGFNLTDKYFVITLKTNKLTQIETDKIVAIKIYYQGGKVTKLELENLFTSNNTNDYISATIELNTFSTVKQMENKGKFINISNSKDLIRAFVNTSNLNDWHINGKIKLDIKLSSAEIKAATVDVDVKVKLDENKGPIIEAVISGYPLVGLVNNKNTNGVGGITSNTKRNRSIVVACKNGEIYLKTRDEKWGAYKELNRTTRITPQTFIDNLSYYIQYIFGFTDSIQDKIDKAVQKSMSYEGKTDYGNIITEYAKSNNSHTFVINLKELAHNDDIGTLTLVLTTLNDSSTGGKDYIYRVDLDLRLLDDLLILRTEQSSSSSGLYLTDIGSSLNQDQANDLINIHLVNNFGLDGEYEKEGSNSWRQENSGTRTVIFIHNGAVVSTQSGNIASALTYPTMSDIIDDNGVERKIYKFVGWYLDEEWLTPFTQNTFPRYDITAYAKYELTQTKYHAVIHFETNKDVETDDLTGFIGDNLVLPVLSNIEIIKDENTSILYEFAGWTTEDGIDYTEQTFVSNSLTLYAKWNEVITKTYRVQIISGGEIVYDGKVASGTTFVFPTLPCFNDSTIYYTSSNFDENTIVTNFVIDGDKVWFAKNMYSVTISSNYTTKGGTSYQDSQTLFEQSLVTLPTFANYTVDNGTYYTEYKFLGYKLNGGNELLSGTVTIPAKNCEFVAEWKVTDYVVVTFHVESWKNPDWWKPTKILPAKFVSRSAVSNTTNNQIVIEKGETINTSNYVATCEYKYGVSYSFKTVAWTTSSVQNLYDSNYNGQIELTINCHITLEPVWKHI